MEAQKFAPIDTTVLRATLLAMIIGTLLLAGVFGGLGVMLVYLGAKGTTHITIFHGSFETTDVGVGSLIVGAIVVLAMMWRVSIVLQKSGGYERKKIWAVRQRRS